MNKAVFQFIAPMFCMELSCLGSVLMGASSRIGFMLPIGRGQLRESAGLFLLKHQQHR